MGYDFSVVHVYGGEEMKYKCCKCGDVVESSPKRWEMRSCSCKALSVDNHNPPSNRHRVIASMENVLVWSNNASLLLGWNPMITDTNVHYRGGEDETTIDNIEAMSAKIHTVYQEEAKQQNNVKYSDNYDELPENIKEYDRVLATWIIKNFTPRIRGEEK